LPTVAQLSVPLVLMHIRGTPQTIKTNRLSGFEREIYQFLESRIRAANASGIDKSQIIVDPGIGFAKTYTKTWKFFAACRCFVPSLFFSGAIPKSFYWSHFESTRPESTSLGNSGGMLCCDWRCRYPKGSRCQANARRLPRC